DRGQLIVMDFARVGMQGAGPRFAHWDGITDGAPRERRGGILEDGGVDKHPDALLIAAAPDMWKALDELEAALDPVIYPQQKKQDFDAPDDHEYDVTITAKQWRAISAALTKARRG
ncbi:MAG: hypothetical protein ACYDAE_28385, partial [Steroidobacteraceae bacterium]